jgi:hypothetical protein
MEEFIALLVAQAIALLAQALLRYATRTVRPTLI